MQKSMACFAIDTEKLPIVKLSNLMPFLIPLLTRIVKAYIFIINTLYKIVPSLMPNIESMTAFWIIDQVEEVVTKRLESGKKRMDLLQLMLDAATHDKVKVELSKRSEYHFCFSAKKFENDLGHTDTLNEIFLFKI
jgi:hypothetical protein